MRYYLDTEFNEYHKQVKIAGIKIGKPIPTIDLISIGIVNEDAIIETKGKGDKLNLTTRNLGGEEYYAICKDFNLKDAWYKNQGTDEEPNYWLRDEVLEGILAELVAIDERYVEELDCFEGFIDWDEKPNEYYKMFKKLLAKHGKSKEQIAKEIKEFVGYQEPSSDITKEQYYKHNAYMNSEIEFYAYYADYDWVVFAQLFGSMMDLPKGFPMYCIDLKQILDKYINDIWLSDSISYMEGVNDNITFESALEKFKALDDYPKQENVHNALADAKWNKELHNFLKTL